MSRARELEGARAASPYRLPQQEPATIWMGHLKDESSVSEAEVRTAFGQYGEIKAVRFFHAKSCVFVEFVKAQAAKDALAALGKSLTVAGRAHPIRLAADKKSAPSSKPAPSFHKRDKR